jgi:Dullard-like phosphatase family protein
VIIDGVSFKVYVKLRPGAIDFINRMSEFYELVVFTASLSKYADPLINMIDPKRLICERYFREKCVPSRGALVKDLSKLGRNLKSLILVDNSPASYSLQPENALPIPTWIDDPNDYELQKLIPILELLSTFSDVRPYIRKITLNYKIKFDFSLRYLEKERDILQARFMPIKNDPQESGVKQFQKSEQSSSNINSPSDFKKREYTQKGQNFTEAAHYSTPIIKRAPQLMKPQFNDGLNHEASPPKQVSPYSQHCFTNLLKIKRNLDLVPFRGRNYSIKLPMNCNQLRNCCGTTKQNEIINSHGQIKSARPTTMHRSSSHQHSLRPPTGKSLAVGHFVINGFKSFVSPSIPNLKIRNLLY